MALADDELTVGKSYARNDEWVNITIRKWDEKEVSNDEEVTQVKVLMALADDKLTVGKSYARNDQWVNITIRKVNTLLSMDEDADWQNYLKELHQAQRTSDHKIYTTSLKRSKNYKAQPYKYASSSKQILKAKAKPFLPCTHYGFNYHRHGDCRNYPKCGICGSYNHFTSGDNCVIHIRGGMLVESSQSSESSIGEKCNTCESTIHSTTNHNDFDYFKRGKKIHAAKARDPTKSWVHKRNLWRSFELMFV
nr:hypothetical protein [Tanacetum cinerariifolium]